MTRILRLNGVDNAAVFFGRLFSSLLTRSENLKAHSKVVSRAADDELRAEMAI
ncbi:MAG: hypothetical protein ACRYGP_02775 [Janthinobacterium lividum]